MIRSSSTMMIPSETPVSSICPPILVIGLGNPILGDDGVGWKVAEQVANRYSTSLMLQPIVCASMNPTNKSVVEVDCLSLGGLALMERMINYQRVIIIDALSTGQSPCGTISISLLSNLPDRALGHLCSAHDTTLQNALRVGSSLGAVLPDEIFVVGIETHQIFDFSTELSPAVLDAIPEAVNKIMELLI